MTSLALGLGLTTVQNPVQEAAPEPASAITLLEIVGPAPLDKTGDYGDPTPRVGIDGNGWVAKATMPFLAGQTFDPSKIVHTITDPGFSATGTTVVTRALRGTVILRRQYNAASSRQQFDDGVTMTVYYALEDVVFQGSTLAAATAEPGYYGGSVSGTVGNRVNNSTRAYYKPLGAWLNMQHDRGAAGGYTVEYSAAHAYGRNGRMVARVEFIGKDSAGHIAATQTASLPVLSSIQTQGNIAEVYRVTIPAVAMNQGDLCTVNAKVYPWIGDLSAVLDLEVDGFAWPTSNPLTPLRFVNDKAATYGGAIAYVRAGAGGFPQVSRNDTTARANPYATIGAAFAALAIFNNANSTPAHNDHSGGTILLMDDGAGGAVEHTMSATIATPAGNCWTDVKADPMATGAITVGVPATRAIPDKVRWFVNINHTAGSGFDGGAGGGAKMLAFAGGTVTSLAATSAQLNYRNGITYLTNVSINASGGKTMLEAFGDTHTQVALALGVIAEQQASDVRMVCHAAIGCRFKRTAAVELNPAAYPNWSSQDARYIVNNWFRNVASMGSFNGLGGAVTYDLGLVFVQNLIETTAPTVGLSICADGTSKSCNNVVVAHNTVVGGRFNHMYADVAAAVGVIKRSRISFNLVGDTWNCKTDTFTNVTTVTGRVGNWETRHSVGNLGNVCINGTANLTPIPSATSWFGDYWPQASYQVGGGTVTFTDDQSLPVGSGAGSGTYSLTGSLNAAYSRVPAGKATLAYDIAGLARNDDGTGAAGCYERNPA